MESIRRVLVLEDNPEVMSAYLRCLRQLSNVHVLAAPNIAIARSFAREYKLHLAVIDRRLPDGDGLEFLAEIRTYDVNVRLLLVSGHNDTASTVKVRGCRCRQRHRQACRPTNVRELHKRDRSSVAPTLDHTRLSDVAAHPRCVQRQSAQQE